MNARDRVANLTLLGVAIVAWAAVGLLFQTQSPVGDVGVALTGAALLGAAVGVTCAPLFWLAAFSLHQRIAYRGDWLRAGRRGAWVALLVALYVVLRSQQAFSLPIGLFVVAMVAFVEVSLSVGG